MDRRCIVVCDSGVGGLNLFNKLATKLKGQILLYYADFDNLPYGEKSNAELEEIARKNYDMFMQFSPKAVVFACNTLSVNTLSDKFYGGAKIYRVLPKVKFDKRGLLLCTEATAKSEYVKNLKTENPLLDVLPLNGLANEVEKSLFLGEQIDVTTRFETVSKNYDFVTLGCTHYSLIEKDLRKIFPSSEFLSGENETFDKIVNFVTTFDTDDYQCEVGFIGKGANKVKSLYFKGFLGN